MLPPENAPPLPNAAAGQAFRMSLSQRAIPPPPCVTNGITVFPLKSQLYRKVRTGGAIVLHQFGVPTKITSYLSNSRTFSASSGLTPALISLFA